MRFKYILKFAVITMLLLIVACGNGDEASTTTVEESSVEESTSTTTVEESSVEEPSATLTVLATTPMIGEFVKKVAGDNIELNILMPYAADPHTFEPSPQDVKKIEDADLVFYTGLKYESVNLLKLLQNSVKSQELLIEVAARINPIEFKEEGHDDHDDHGDEEGHDDHDDHGDEDGHAGHDHGIYDPHFWFDPTRVALAVGEIRNELIKLDPDNKDAYESAATSYIAELTALDAQVEALIQTVPSNDRQIVTTHESLGYLEARYGLSVLVAIIPSVTSEDDVTPRQLVSVIEEVKEQKVKVIFLEAESPTKSSEIVAQETGATLVSGLWVETLQENQSYIDFINSNVNLIVENLIKYGHEDDHDDHGDEDKHDDHDDHGDEDKHDDHDDHGDEDKHDDHDDHGDEDKHDDHDDEDDHEK
ncbi:MAG: metal ABC transporter substrate-binding protein [SAR202 cluster bacterium]|nr:metal ABC transporter substrate-binding protein [SAR202 cluster bacterium]